MPSPRLSPAANPNDPLTATDVGDGLLLPSLELDGQDTPGIRPMQIRVPLRTGEPGQVPASDSNPR